MKRNFYGWKLLALLCLHMMLTTGVLAYGMPVLITDMVKDMGLNRKSLGLAIGCYSIGLGLAAPLAGYAIHRIGAKRGMMTGTLLLAAGALLMATTVHSLAGTLVVLASMGCAEPLCTSIPTKTVVSYWFRRRVALALTLSTLGTNIGGAIAPPSLSLLVIQAGGNWRIGWYAVMLTCLLAFVLTTLFVVNEPEELGQRTDGAGVDGERSVAAAATPRVRFGSTREVYKTSFDFEFRDIIRRPSAWWMVAGVFCATGGLSVIVGHGVANLTDRGFSATTAAGFLSIVAGIGVAGRLLFAAVGDYVEPRFIFAAALLSAASGLILLETVKPGADLQLIAALLGLGFSLPTMCLMAMVVNYFGRTGFSRFMGIVMSSMSVGPALAVTVAGAVFDRFGTYSPVLLTVAAALLVVGVAMPFVTPPRLPAMAAS